MEGYCSTDQSPQWAVVPMEEEEEEGEEEENYYYYYYSIMWYAKLPAALFRVCSWYSDWAVECTIQDFIPGRYKRIFASPTNQTHSQIHPTSCSMGTRGSYLGTKATGSNTDCSPRSSAKVKNEWSYTCAPPVRLHSEHRENFTFTFLLLHNSCGLMRRTR